MIHVIVLPYVVKVFLDIVVCLFLGEFVVSQHYFIGSLFCQVFSQVEKTAFGSILFSALNGPLFDQRFHQKITLVFFRNLASVSKVVFFVASWETLVDQVLTNVWLRSERPRLLNFIWSISLGDIFIKLNLKSILDFDFT